MRVSKSCKVRRRAFKRGLNFLDIVKTNGVNDGSHDTRNHVISYFKRMAKTETTFLALKIALTKLESEKEDGLV